MDVTALALNALVDLPSEAEPGRLAYLVLTTKSEQPIRDQWAWVLCMRHAPELVVAREWKRADIALLQNGKARLLIEISAMYTFDAVLKPRYLADSIRKMEADEQKARQLCSTAEILTVLLATDPKSAVPEALRSVVKYDVEVNSAIWSCGSTSAVRERAIGAIDRSLLGKNVIGKGELLLGAAFGVSVGVLYWVVKASTGLAC